MKCCLNNSGSKTRDNQNPEIIDDMSSSDPWVDEEPYYQDLSVPTEFSLNQYSGTPSRQPSHAKKLRDWCGENWKFLFFALFFTAPDTSLYWSSINNFPKHLGFSDHPITHLETEMDTVGFVGMTIGAGCTLFSNIYSYYFINKTFWSERALSPFVLEGKKKLLIGLIISISILNKSIATSTSFLAFLNDYIESAVIKYPNFGLALIANLLAQLGVQGISTGWHFGVWPCRAKALALFFSLYYTASVLALNWNAIDNMIGFRPSLDFDSTEGILKLASTPLFLCALIRTPIVYSDSIGNRLLSENECKKKEREKKEQQTPPRTCGQRFCYWLQKLLGHGAAFQRTGIMLGAFAAASKAATESLETAALVAAGIFSFGTYPSNLAVLGVDDKDNIPQQKM